MELYLLSEQSKHMPLHRPIQSKKYQDYDQKRRYTLQTNLSNLYTHQAMKQAISTYTDIIKNGNAAKSSLFKNPYPEVSALSAVLYPRCGTCRQHNCPLYRCCCCGIVHFCSHQCQRSFLIQYPLHRTLDQRFGHFELFQNEKRKRIVDEHCRHAMKRTKK